MKTIGRLVAIIIAIFIIYFLFNSKENIIGFYYNIKNCESALIRLWLCIKIILSVLLILYSAIYFAIEFYTWFKSNLK